MTKVCPDTMLCYSTERAASEPRWVLRLGNPKCDILACLENTVIACAREHFDGETTVLF